MEKAARHARPALHLPHRAPEAVAHRRHRRVALAGRRACRHPGDDLRSEEHTSELQSRLHLVCRLLLEKKKKITNLLRVIHIVDCPIENLYYEAAYVVTHTWE